MVHHGKVVAAVDCLSAHGADIKMTQFVHGTISAKLSRRAPFGESSGYEIHHRQAPC
jgi:hypothetical protein